MRITVSSSATIFWKFFFPCFWGVFFLTLTLGMIFTDVQPTSMPKTYFSILLGGTLLLGLVLFAMTVFRLKRVEMDEQFVYVTNYFKWFRYPYHNIDRITEKDWMLFKTVTIILKEKGTFGKKIFFLANHRKLNGFLKENPEVIRTLFNIDS